MLSQFVFALKMGSEQAFAKHDTPTQVVIYSLGGDTAENPELEKR